MTTARRRRMWTDRFIDEVGVPGEFDEELLINPGDEAEKGMTLVRMIIDLTLRPVPPVSGSLNTVEVSMGIGLVSSEVNAGSIRVDLEGETPMSGWLWRTRFTIGETLNETGDRRINVDIRSQRKLMYGEPRLFIGYVLQQGAGFFVETVGLIRSLYLMP